MMRPVSVPGKRVSWVEAYLDLIFVLAVSRLAHVIEAKPEMASVWTALGLFVILWWTWIGFAVLYNRRGRDARPQRLLFLAGSVPAGVAAVAIAPAAEGHSAAFALSMAVTRLVLAGAQAEGEGWRDVLSRRISRAYLVAAGLFVVSIWVPEPGRYVLWAIAVAGESGVLLRDDRRAVRAARQTHDVAALGPVDPGEALDPHHFAERFGLFLIILLGEVLVSAGDLPVGEEGATLGGWGSVAAAMVLAAALWWLYFDSAADFNLRVLELSGGSPAMARALFAAGHMHPAFALILIASGLSLLLEGDARASPTS
jgi:low temperature requirement protein LtrA